MSQANPGHESPNVILLVEDDFVVALDLTDILEEAGFEVRGPAASVSQALNLLGGQRPDAAVLDLNLGREWSTPVACALRRQGVPFLIASGRRCEEMPDNEAIQQAPKLMKPVGAAAFVESVRALLRTPAN